MKKTITLLWVFFSLSLCAQNNSVKIGKKENFYLTINKGETYFVKDVHNRGITEPIPKELTLNLKRNSLDIYLNWINPLQYKLIIQDSIVNDLRVEEVKKFFKENISGLAGGFSLIKPASSGRLPLDCSRINGKDDVSKMFPEVYNSFHSDSLTDADSDLCEYWQMMDALLKLQLPKEEKKLKEVITNLYEADSPEKARIAYSTAEGQITWFSKYNDEIVARLYQIDYKAGKIENVSLGLLKQKMQQFHKELSKSFESSKKLIELLKTYMIQIKTSFRKKAPMFEDHYRIKTLSLSSGKSIKVKISLSPRELSKDDLSLKDKAKIKEHDILIQKYDFITPKVGTGLFYSSATLNGFGVSTNDQDELIVTKDDIERNTAVTGVFLNLNFDINSQFLSPLLQIGVDPTKERPYLLLGGGFSIPVSNFAISAGPIWTWEAELNNLSLDDVVSSTSVLEEDVSYKFQTKPRGFYLGLNYSF